MSSLPGTIQLSLRDEREIPEDRLLLYSGTVSCTEITGAHNHKTEAGLYQGPGPLNVSNEVSFLSKSYVENTQENIFSCVLYSCGEGGYDVL